MKRRSSLRQGIDQLRRGLLQVSRQARAGRKGRIDVAVRENIVVTHNSGQPGSHVHASSAQYAPIVQRGRESHDPGTGSNSKREERS